MKVVEEFSYMFPSKNIVQMAYGNPHNQSQRSQIPPDLFRQGVMEHAASLGMDPAVDGAFLWIAEKSLQESLPMNWVQLNTDEGDVYFYNQFTGESSWEHPKDEYYRNLFLDKKAMRSSGIQSTVYIDNRSNLDHSMDMYKNGSSSSHSSGSSHLKRRRKKSFTNEGDPCYTSTDYNNIESQLPINANEASSWYCSNNIEEDVEWQNVFSPKQKTQRKTASPLVKHQQKSSNVKNMIDDAQNALHSLKEEMRMLSLSDEDECLKTAQNDNTPRERSSSEIELSNKVQSTQKHLETRCQKIKDLTSQIEKYKEKEKEFLNLKEAIKLLKEQNKDFKANAKEKELELKAELDNIIAQKKVLEQQSCSTKTQSEFELKISEKDLVITKLRARCESESLASRQKLFDLEVKFQELNEEIMQKTRLCDDYAKELQNKNDLLSLSDEKKKALKDQLESLHKDCVSKEENVKHHKDLLEEATLSKNQSITRIGELQRQVCESQESTNKALNESKRHTESLQKYEEQFASSEELMESMRSDLKTWKNKYVEEKEKVKTIQRKILDLQGNIRVFCRIRPLSSKEQRDLIASGLDVSDIHKSVQYLDDDRLHFHGANYEYDRVFAPNAIQGSVFSEIAPAISSAMEGHSVCIFAYGQTGSGKTYTMEGKKGDRGVNYRALAELFDIAKKATAELDYTFAVSVLEVYNESIHDLLIESNTNSHSQGLSIHMRKDRVYVEGLIEQNVNSSEEIESIMALASNNRRTANNNVNEHSSRSHLVLSIKIHGRSLQSGTRINGKLNLIDLAGSERLKHTSAHGQRLKEAQNINRSLSSLGDVVAALGSGSKHIPYRNSKLTFLLQDSLCTKAKVLMFVNINPSPKSMGESVCSLKFAARCRAVQLGKSKKETNALLKRRDSRVAIRLE